MVESPRSVSTAGRITTGVEGLDRLMRGGFPGVGVTLIVGGPGAGKTVLTMQALARAAALGEPGVLVAFEENAAQLVANMASFVWGAELHEESSIQMIDAQLGDAVERSGEFDLVGLLGMVSSRARSLGARRVVFDGLDVLLAYLGDAALVRRECFRLRHWVQEQRVCALLTAKATDDDRPDAGYEFLQFMADCVLTLHHRVVQGTALRSLRVAKYRGVAHSANEVPLSLTELGLEVAAETDMELAYPVSTERVSTGVERLDAMLSGGYYRGSSVLVTGAPGSAKTTLAAAFADGAARRGERTCYLSFDEAPEQVARNMASVGLGLRAHVERGLLALHAMRGRSASPEGHVARIRALIAAERPQNLILDPISALSSTGYRPEANAAALQLLDLTKRAGITIVSTSLLGNSVPLGEETAIDVSTIADTWIHLTYVNQGGERNRALTIIKSRGTGHSNQMRELVLSSEGITLADVYVAGGEVLMGTLRWEQENAARRARAAAMSSAALRERKAAIALAEVQSQQEALARERALREQELQSIQEEAVVDAQRHSAEGDELLQRRRADPPRAGGHPDRSGSS